VTVEFEPQATPIQRAPAPAPTPSPAPAPTATPEPPIPQPPIPESPAPEPPAPEPPRPAPPPPTPSPPAPPPPAPAPPVVTAPMPTPPPPAPPVQRPPAPAAPTPPALEQVAPAPLPLPPIAPPLPIAPRPPSPPQPAAVQPTPPVPPPRPAAPAQTPPPATSNATNQPNPVRNPAPDGDPLAARIKQLRAQEAAKEPSRAPTNPTRSGAPGGGSPASTDNAQLNVSLRNAISDRLRDCWTGDRTAFEYDKQTVRLIVTTDPTGTIRVADIAPSDLARTRSGVARAFADRAKRAALDPRCAQLPLPPDLKGQNHTFEITFRP